MIENGADFFEARGHVSEIFNPARFRIGFAFNGDFQHERVTVQARVRPLVGVDMQIMRGVECDRFHDTHEKNVLQARIGGLSRVCR